MWEHELAPPPLSHLETKLKRFFLQDPLDPQETRENPESVDPLASPALTDSPDHKARRVNVVPRVNPEKLDSRDLPATPDVKATKDRRAIEASSKLPVKILNCFGCKSEFCDKSEKALVYKMS